LFFHEKLHLLEENTPHSVAAGAIFFVSHVCGQNINKKDVKRISDISEVTLNKCYKQLNLHRQVLIPPMIAVKYRVSGV
jgi:transcription initiation factor TFIIIB Brf1 subunit/transcription initiation factor TFIIB